MNRSSNYDLIDEGQGYYNTGNAGYYEDTSSSAMHPEGFYSDPNVYGQAYGGDASPYYPTPDYEYHSHSQLHSHSQSQQFDAYVDTVHAKEGSFYFHTEMVPLVQTAVTSLALDASWEAMYLASTTQNVSSSRWKPHRASMLLTHNTRDGMLYSSVAGHPEASPSTLQTVYECLFGIPKTMPLPRQHIPPHAYRAPFGGGIHDVSGNSPQMGITTILPLDGYVATISPAAVRIHAQGGLQLHDCDMEGMLTATIHPHSDQGSPSHISVGGIPCHSHHNNKHRDQEIHCMDLWQGLRIVSSRSFKDRYEKRVGVTALATSHQRGSIVAGCSDGHLRLLDGALREVATVKCHKGGVSSISISPDGMLIATTGYSSRVKGTESSILYAYPDPTVFIYDIRRLGQAGIPHPFAGARSSPHHVAFLPDIKGLASNRLLVGSGQSGGGLQVMVPFETHIDKSTSFLIPQLEQGESITALAQADADLALGTSQGRVLTYKYAGYTSTKLRAMKEPLVIPPFVPPPPPISIDPNLLLPGSDPGMRPGDDERMRAIVSNYILRSDPKLTSIGNTPEEALPQFGPLGASKIIPSARRTIAPTFIGDAKPAPGDFITTILTTNLGIDLLADHNPISKRYKGKKAREPKPNPNKLLYNAKLSSLCYDDGGKRKYKGQRSSGSVSCLNIHEPMNSSRCLLWDQTLLTIFGCMIAFP